MSVNSLNDAGTIWKFLETMAARNPAEYKRFVDGVLKEGKENDMGPPEPSISIQTNKLPETVPVRKYFINIATWLQLAKPPSPNGNVPVSASKPRKEVVEKEWAVIVDVAVHPIIFENDSPFQTPTKNLIEIVLSYIEQTHSLVLSRKYCVMTEKYTGNADCLLDFMCPSSLRDTLTSQAPDRNDVKIRDSVNKCEIKESCEGKGSVEMKESRESSQSIQLTKPKVELVVDKEEAILSVVVALPKVTGVAECDLELIENNMLLTVPDKYKLDLDLPFSIDVNKSTAKFVKDVKRLTINAPIIRSETRENSCL